MAGNSDTTNALPQEGHPSSAIQDLNKRYMELMHGLEAAKAKRVAMEKCLKALESANPVCAWATNIEDKSLEELEQLGMALSLLKRKTDDRVYELLVRHASTPAASMVPLVVNPISMMVNDVENHVMAPNVAGNMGQELGRARAVGNALSLLKRKTDDRVYELLVRRASTPAASMVPLVVNPISMIGNDVVNHAMAPNVAGNMGYGLGFC
ncbi:hypothetical protein J5N97_028438 [Dioscorea zingiberensis]|uniref:Uncharacterized protein n=1 Tax=Dioscorea zingiberensis TaxID=325984 RepID=A0A9D5H4U2_9LILI|nr:hypothetical protein J5N97_028438 [Dioscorea zingiberensis]